MMRRTTVLLTMLFLLVSGVLMAAGQPEAAAGEYPTRPIRVIVATAAGGGTDLLGRMMAAEVESILGTPLVVENREGGSMTIGTTFAAQVEPDGYTILFSPSGPIVTQPHILDNLQYSLDDFRGIMGVISVPVVFAVQAGSPLRTIDDLIAGSGSLTTGHAGPGTLMHLAQEDFFGKLNNARLDVQQVPHQGGARTVAALLGGHVDLVTALPSEVLPYVDDGQLRVLATTAASRPSKLADVPTLSEKGFDVVMELRFFVLAPKDTPDHIVRVLEDAFIQAAGSERIRNYADESRQEIDIKNGVEIMEALRTDFEYFGSLMADL